MDLFYLSNKEPQRPFCIIFGKGRAVSTVLIGLFTTAERRLQKLYNKYTHMCGSCQKWRELPQPTESVSFPSPCGWHTITSITPSVGGARPASYRSCQPRIMDFDETSPARSKRVVRSGRPSWITQCFHGSSLQLGSKVFPKKFRLVLHVIWECCHTYICTQSNTVGGGVRQVVSETANIQEETTCVISLAFFWLPSLQFTSIPDCRQQSGWGQTFNSAHITIWNQVNRYQKQQVTFSK